MRSPKPALGSPIDQADLSITLFLQNSRTDDQKKEALGDQNYSIKLVTDAIAETRPWITNRSSRSFDNSFPPELADGRPKEGSSRRPELFDQAGNRCDRRNPPLDHQ